MRENKFSFNVILKCIYRYIKDTRHKAYIIEESSIYW